MSGKAIKKRVGTRNKAISPITAQIRNPFDSLFGCLCALTWKGASLGNRESSSKKYFKKKNSSFVSNYSVRLFNGNYGFNSCWRFG